MADTEPELQALMDGVRASSKQRYARWDDNVFAQVVSWPAGYLWRTLKKQSAKVRDRSVLTYLNAVASGIGSGYVTGEVTAYGGTSATLMECFLCRLMPTWLAMSPPKSHAHIAATAWNLAEGARREAAWMEQYLLARAGEFRDPMALEQKAVDLLKPVLEPQRDAAWKGPFKVTVVDPAMHMDGFLPGEISMVTPSLVQVGDRRHKTAVGVLLVRGTPECIGRMSGAPAAGAPPSAPAVPVTWAADRVTVADTAVPLPLMGCVPLHTLTLANGFMLAAVQNSQRLWVVETP
jgi:hypothetical protein